MYDAGKEDYLRPSQHIALCTIVAHNIAQNRLIEYGFNVPLNTLQVISGTGFYGSNDPTDSVKPMKEVVVLRIGFSPTRFTLPCYKPTDAYRTVYNNTHNTYKNESKHSEMGPVRQNPIQRTVRSVHVRALHCAQLLHTILHRTDLIIFPLTTLDWIGLARSHHSRVCIVS